MGLGSHHAIYLAQANLNSVPFEGFMGNGFTAGGQRTAAINVENFPGFPTRILGPELMDKFREQSLLFGTRIITETISKIDFIPPSEDEEPETADTVIRLGLKGEGVCWQSGVSAGPVCDGAVTIFRNKPLAIIGGGDPAAKEATCTSDLTKYGSHIYVLTIVWNTVANECQDNGELLRNLRIKNVTNPQRRSFRTQLQTDPDGFIVTVSGTTQTSVRGVFATGDVQDKSAGNGCMATLEAERLIAEEEEKEMMGE
ncbi:hypothetical protein K435DRAFT_822828 [Dendrothele bispora CBS 962.96]|uniref:FAD/NAD(P)-binding domain-containing protein n=1 Tax=Dendrothele bispora (strain CBS 962.96) TaxID=1314807 RepID=A0A4S8L5Z9_DENBC|nr:hypothetical protein K435DRAFT_822828 [Dendrothele bispora CBS 962.96]